jgi:hypothetical protein
MDHTPQTYQYEPLRSTEYFRIINLLPSDKCESAINLRLSEVKFAGNQDYEALSYTWGSTEDPKSIECDAGTLKITRNCETALRHLRYPKTSRMLWIDAICINQVDIPERNQQVARMREIYKNATQVLIWLGDGHPNADLAIQFLSSFEPILDKRGTERGEFVARKVNELEGKRHTSSYK